MRPPVVNSHKKAVLTNNVISIKNHPVLQAICLSIQGQALP